MRIAASNLAWDPDQDAEVAQLMRSLGIEGLEVAPTRIWDDPLSSSPDERKRFRDSWSERGISIVSLQSLLFGRPDLVIFGSAASRAATLEYLGGMIQLAADLGASRLVFGSPKNRTRGTMSADGANKTVVPFFRAIGDLAVAAGVVFCIEPNPVQYDCDWITTISDGHELVLDIAHEGIALNADAGGITLGGEHPSTVIPGAIGSIAHFHVSEPHLVPIGTGSANHEALARALRSGDYRGWASIEMRLPPPENRMNVLTRSFSAAASAYE
jgi:sugar phosphate isomerase/epimerase